MKEYARMKTWIRLSLCGALCMSLAGCAAPAEESAGTETRETPVNEVTEETVSEPEDSEAVTGLSKIDSTAWLYNADEDVYYQTGIPYCETPADSAYETLAVFVPGAYMDAKDNGDGTYTCTINEEAAVNGYTALSAPIAMPINTPGYSAQAALSDYTDVTDYTNAGFVYVHAGCRGRDAGAPAGVTDIKAAIRYVRYSDDTVPGDAESIFTFGMSGGGAQSAIVGASGDSELYEPYLAAIGAVQGVSDAVLGSMDWCPITNLDTADESYEWMMGSTRSGLSEDERAISDALAEAFAEYINEAGFKDENGNVLTLEESENGIYQAGTYYLYMKSVIEQSLNNFLADTSFPYEASSSAGGMHGGMGRGEKPSGERPEGFEGKPEGMPEGGPDGNNTGIRFEDIDDIERNETASGLSLSGTYETAQDYIDALNANGEWVTYDSSTNTVTITSIEAFVKNLKTASKNLGAFDQLDSGQGENTLFGYGDGTGAHFDSTLASILEELGNEYADTYAADLEKTDSAGNMAKTRLNMYTPLYYLMESYDGYGTSSPAKYWRIRSGINQSDTALSTELNLALALENYEGVESVDFETVWGEGHTQAERTGNSTSNFIAWVEACTK